MATIGQIAAELGISKSTVSRALRGLPGVSQDLIDEVKAVAERMGYVPSAAAAGLTTGRNYAVGVVVPALTRWFYSEVVSGVDRALAAAGYDVVLYDMDRNHDVGTRAFARSLLRKRVDALIVVATVFTEHELAEFDALEMPVIAVGPSAPQFRTIGVDDHAIMAAAMEHMLGLGHRQLGYVGGYDEESLSLASAADREHTFMKTALAAGALVQPEWMLAGGYKQGAAMRATRELFSRDSWPTGLVCASDEMAMGAICAIHAAGKRVPEDVSVIGIDGHEYGADYELTTMAQNPQAQGEWAARQVVAEIEGATPVQEFEPAPFTLIQRGSTAAPGR